MDRSRSTTPPHPADKQELSGVRKRCAGPAWIQEGLGSFKSCPPQFVCDDPACLVHEWGDPDALHLRDLRRDRDAMMAVHIKVIAKYGPGSGEANPHRTKASLGAFLRANSRLYTFVVRKAVERSHRSV